MAWCFLLLSMSISLGCCFVFRPSQTSRTTMRVWNTLGCFAVVWTLHVCLFETRSIHHHRISTIVVCRIFASSNTAYAVCSTDGFNDSYMAYVDDPCSTSSSNVMCDKLEFLSPTSCLAGKKARVIQKVISANFTHSHVCRNFNIAIWRQFPV